VEKESWSKDETSTDKETTCILLRVKMPIKVGTLKHLMYCNDIKINLRHQEYRFSLPLQEDQATTSNEEDGKEWNSKRQSFCKKTIMSIIILLSSFSVFCFGAVCNLVNI
jgi:hypothetical protein